MSDFITTAEAAKLLGVTARTIRRKVAKLDKITSAKYVRKDGKGILISKSFVLSNFTQATPPPEPIETSRESQNNNNLVQLLEDQLKAKDEQIKALTIALQESQERQKESNYLLGKEQQERQALSTQLDELRAMIGQGTGTEDTSILSESKEVTPRDGMYFILIGLVLVVLFFLLVGQLFS
jgi:excisionase family DNA binding protein